MPKFYVQSGSVRLISAAGPTAGSPPKISSAPGVEADAAVAGSKDGSAVRHFEFVEGKSSKFWEISADGCEVTVRYGRIGATGTSNVKTFADAEAAQRDADKLIAEKTGKGYVETGTWRRRNCKGRFAGRVSDVECRHARTGESAAHTPHPTYLAAGLSWPHFQANTRPLIAARYDDDLL